MIRFGFIGCGAWRVFFLNLEGVHAVQVGEADPLRPVRERTGIIGAIAALQRSAALLARLGAFEDIGQPRLWRAWHTVDQRT